MIIARTRGNPYGRDNGAGTSSKARRNLECQIRAVLMSVQGHLKQSVASGHNTKRAVHNNGSPQMPRRMFAQVDWTRPL